MPHDVVVQRVQVRGPLCHGPLCHPGENPGANIWFVWSTPIQMLPPGGSVCGRRKIYPWVAFRVPHDVVVLRVQVRCPLKKKFRTCLVRTFGRARTHLRRDVTSSLRWTVGAINHWLCSACRSVARFIFFSALRNSNLSQNNRMPTTHRSPSTDDRDSLQTS